MSNKIGARTQEQIVARIRERIEADILGFEVSDLLVCLDFEHAKAFLKEDADAKSWNAEIISRSPDDVRNQIVDYLPFAVDKAVNQRGISASRSVSHLTAWFWLMGDDEMTSWIENDAKFEPYGAPILLRAHERLGVPVPDNPIFTAMAKGEAV